MARSGPTLASMSIAPAAIPSPCISVCRMEERTGWCEGCLRTLNEIAEWSTMDNRAKRAVWKLLPPRRQQLERNALDSPLPGAQGGTWQGEQNNP